MTIRVPFLRIAATSLGLCSTLMAHAQKLDAARLAPTEYRSHFAPNPGASADSGSRDGWESYPLVEDAGYDPTLNPVTTHGESMLTRATAPTQDGLFRLGFIRRLHMVPGTSASLHMRVRLPDAAGNTSVHISIFHGKREERHDTLIPGDQWSELNVKLLPSSDPITAVAIAAEFPHAIHERQERIFLQDVSLKAMATKRIELRSPEALWDPSRELYYLQRALRPGSDLHVTLNTPSAPDLHWTLASPDGSIQAQGTGTEIQHRFTASDTPGAWTLNIASHSAQTTALLLLRPAQPKGIAFDQPPTLSPELLHSIRARRDKLRSTVHVEMGNNIARMDPQWVLPGLPSYFSILSQPPELAMLDAIDYRATGDQAALTEARTLLANIAHWPRWVHPWFPAHGYHSYYPVGIMAKQLAMAAQFLGEALPATEHDQLDRSLMNLAVRPIYEEYVLEDRLQFNTSNWIGNTAGGALVAALASDDPDAAGYVLGLYIKERDHARAAYTPDGSYGEGVSYQRFDLEGTALAAAASKRILGQSFDDSLLSTERYQRYAAYNKEAVLDYGDSHVDLKPTNVFAYLASLNQSDRLTGFYFKYRGEQTGDLLSRVLWESAIHPAQSPTAPEPASHLFDQRGVVVLRDSWNTDAAVIAMRAGKNFNHNHADQGSIFFARAGKLWLGEAGYADYYKDPAYPTFNIQAIGHDTLLVDGDPESQILPGNAVFGTSPSITHNLITPQASLVQADLTTSYAAKLTRYTRTLFFQSNGPLIVIDQVQADTPHTYTQVWHPKQKVDAFDASQNSFHLTSGDHHLSVQAFADTPLTTGQKLSPLPLASYEKAEHETIERPTRFEIASTKPQTNATIVTVIDPDHRKSAAWTQTSNTQTLTLEGAELELDRTNATITARWAHNALALHTTHYQDRGTGRALFTNKPVDMQLTQKEDGTIQLEINASEATDLRLQAFSTQDSTHIHPGHTTLTLR